MPAPENLYTGEIGKMCGVRFVQSTEAKIDKGGESLPTGLAVFHCLFIGDGAYGVTEVTGGGLQTIVKQKGSAGTADPLDQRSSVGWKGMKTAKILVDNYLVDLCAALNFQPLLPPTEFVRPSAETSRRTALRNRGSQNVPAANDPGIAPIMFFAWK